MVKRFMSYKVTVLVAIFVILFGLVSWLSLSSIHQLQGNARVINYVGIVRGATQRLIKKELQGYPDNALINRLNSIVDELLTGVGPNNLVVLPDEDYLENMRQVKESWAAIKVEIDAMRRGKDSFHLYDLSEDYFFLVDKTVSSAEAFTEQQVGRSNRTLLGVNAAFILLLTVGLIYYIRTVALKRRAEMLGKLAYFDQLTKLPNRASCNREMAALAAGSPGGDIGVIMFDMNNLKRVNDELGHQG
ncbi:MAG: diguanylate cyclase, partial [Candidatus Adiutrix sp.]|nr:diguanylate cyclase [Candidatus Adiutrix sp.]